MINVVKGCIFAVEVENIQEDKCFCVAGIYDTNISHQIFDYKITFENSQIQKVILFSKPGFKRSFKDFWYTRLNLPQIWYEEHTQHKFLTSNFNFIRQTKPESKIYVIF